jgi:hypothetical protein
VFYRTVCIQNLSRDKKRGYSKNYRKKARQNWPQKCTKNAKKRPSLWGHKSVTAYINRSYGSFKCAHSHCFLCGKFCSQLTNFSCSTACPEFIEEAFFAFLILPAFHFYRLYVRPFSLPPHIILVI